jgi:glycerol-3-phosphate dehydrogenase
MNRDEAWLKASSQEAWDVVIIGGGATGLGAALEATTRGLKTILLEKRDFASATSSRSTKLVHGGVRYLQQGNISLVREALHERARLLVNAPHLVEQLFFVIPCYSMLEKLYYRAGMAAYDCLAGLQARPKSRMVSPQEVEKVLPTLKNAGLSGGVEYWDGQFDDARLAVTLARTATECGATILNYAPVTGLVHEAGKICGVECVNSESGESAKIRAKCVINATGIFVDDIRKWSEPSAKNMLAFSQGIHLVLPSRFLQSHKAIIVPKTKDGRVVFIIPWHGSVVVGTTDTPISSASYDPEPQDNEVEFLLEHAGMYLQEAPTKSDIRAVFVGIRPLVRGSGQGNQTSKLSRDHSITVDSHGLITITGGKWTTYRKMGQDVIDESVKRFDLKASPTRTADLRLVGASLALGESDFHDSNIPFDSLRLYGSERKDIEKLIEMEPALGERLAEDYPYRKAEVVWAIRREMARSVEDILFRRTRLGFLDQHASQSAATTVQQILLAEGLKVR